MITATFKMFAICQALIHDLQIFILLLYLDVLGNLEREMQ